MGNEVFALEADQFLLRLGQAIGGTEDRVAGFVHHGAIARCIDDFSLEQCLRFSDLAKSTVDRCQLVAKPLPGTKTNALVFGEIVRVAFFELGDLFSHFAQPLFEIASLGIEEFSG